MASLLGYGEESRSQRGEETLEHRKVRENLPSIIYALKANKAACESLCIQLKQKTWVELTDDPPPNEMMNIVLNRIKDDASQFQVFMAILNCTTGLDLIKKRIDQTSFNDDVPVNMGRTGRYNGHPLPQEPPEKYALRHNIRSDIITAIARDLSGFQQSFVQHDFIAAQAADEIMSIMGITNIQKANRLFQSLDGKLSISTTPQNTFELFVGILAADEVTKDLAMRILENYVEKVPEYNGRLRELLPETTDVPTCTHDNGAVENTEVSEVPTNTVVPRRRTLHATPPENEMLWSQRECNTMSFQDRGLSSTKPKPVDVGRKPPVLRASNRRCGMITIAVLLLAVAGGYYLYQGEYVSVLQSQTSSSSRGTDATSNTVPSRLAPHSVWMDMTPDIALLHLIKYTDAYGKEVKYYFIQEIQNKCKKLGTTLGIDRETILSFSKRSDTSEEFCESILSEWIGRGVDGDRVTWGGLLRALKDAQLGGGPYNNLKKALTLYFN